MTTPAPGQAPMRGILLIAYHFPPSAAVGGMRMANFARFLSSFGWEPWVLTIRVHQIAETDPDRRKGLEDISVHEAPVLPTIETMYAALKRRLRPAPAAREKYSTPGVGAGAYVERGEATVDRLKRWILSFLVLPDRERGWILPAVVAAIRQVRRYKMEWMMTSCPPYSGHIVGLVVKGVTGTRWVADFRDPWITTGGKRLYPTSALSLRIESWLERKVIENADLVLFNVQRLRDAYRERYRAVPGERLVFIPNAVPPEAIRDKAPVPKYETFTLSYTGSLYLGRSPEPICQAIALLIRKGRVAPDQVRLRLVGHCRDVGGVPTSDMARRYGLESVVEVNDPLPYADAMEIVSRSHLALLFAPDLPFQIPAKIYDYLGAGTRILAIAEDGGTADLVRDTGSGRAFAPGDVEAIAEFIHDEMTALPSLSSPNGVSAALARFDVRRITEDLVGHLGRTGTASRAAG